MNIHAFPYFNSVEGTFQSKFTLTLKWFDARVTFNNLRPSPAINKLKPLEVEELWSPQFRFETTETKEINVVDKLSSVNVLKMGEGQVSGIDDLENKYVYEGSENPIEYRRYYFKEFECEYSLHWYPFDKQFCYIDIARYKVISRTCK